MYWILMTLPRRQPVADATASVRVPLKRLPSIDRTFRYPPCTFRMFICHSPWGGAESVFVADGKCVRVVNCLGELTD